MHTSFLCYTMFWNVSIYTSRMNQYKTCNIIPSFLIKFYKLKTKVRLQLWLCGITMIWIHPPVKRQRSRWTAGGPVTSARLQGATCHYLFREQADHWRKCFSKCKNPTVDIYDRCHIYCVEQTVCCSVGLMQVSETNKVIISDTYCWPSSEGSEATWPTCRRWQQTRRWPMGQSNRTGKVCPLPHTAPRPGSLDGKVPGVKWIGKHETHSQILMVFHA